MEHRKDSTKPSPWKELGSLAPWKTTGVLLEKADISIVPNQVGCWTLKTFVMNSFEVYFLLTVHMKFPLN